MNKIYSRLAFTNIKNNKTLYMPYIISGMVMIAMFYVMMFLNNSKGLGKVPGADALASIMGLGCGTIAVCSYIFLFYTNSFIIKRRKKEVGIYNILGMEKRHIARVLIIETLTVALAAIVSGIIAGILFSKLMIMFLYRIINIKAQIDFAVSTGAVVNTILIFGVLYFLTLIYNLMQVKLANPIELLRGGNVGEKQMAYRYNRTRLSCRGILYCDYHKEPSSGAFTVLCRSAACHRRNVSFIYFRKHCDT